MIKLGTTKACSELTVTALVEEGRGREGLWQGKLDETALDSAPILQPQALLNS